MNSEITHVENYFRTLGNALDGLDTYLQEDDSPLYKHDVIAAVVVEYLQKLRSSLNSWKNKTAFGESFKISQTESGFPVFGNVLELQNDREGAKEKLASMADEDEIREDMVDFILKKKQFPKALQRMIAERRYFEAVQNGEHFSPFILPQTIRVSANPKTKRPYYVVHWGYYDGTANLPMIYMVTLEDSSEEIVGKLIGKDGRLNKKVKIKMPVEGLLNPDLALKFDDFCEKNSAYSLTLSTIGTNLDKDFDYLHPKQIRRFVLGPFYHSALTRHGERVDEVLSKVRQKDNAWLMTWTLQEIYSMEEKPAKWGLWGGEPAREKFYINTDDLECARQGVSAFQRHAIVPHEAYQAIYASGAADEIFDGYKTHVISEGHVLRNM